MNKRQKIGLIFIIFGLFIPTVSYPFTTLNPSERLWKFLYGSKKLPYDSPKFFNREVVFVHGKPENSPLEKEYGVLVNYEGRVAIPYKFVFAFGITISFIGIFLIILSQKLKT